MMQVSELYELTEWIDENVAKTAIPKKYANLIAPIQQSSQPNQAAQPFEEQKEALFAALRQVPLTELSTQQREVLKEIGILDQIGQDAINLIENVLRKNVSDLASTHTKISEFQSKLNSGIAWAKETNNQLRRIQSLTIEESLTEDEVLIRVRFTEKASIENVADLKKWGAAWWEISRGITMIAGQAPESVRVVGASSGSVIISLATVYSTAKIIAAIEKEILSFIERAIGIRIQIEQLRSMRLSNDAAEKALLREIELDKDKKTKEITHLAIEQLGATRPIDGDQTNSFEKAVAKLLDFHEKGGELDFVIAEDPEPADEEEQSESEAIEHQNREELRAIVNSLRQIESKIRRLGYDPEDD